MTVKQSVLRALGEARGASVSGEVLAQSLGVSRAAVWKAIKSLQGEGYRISAGTNRGYRLEEYPDLLTAEGISAMLPLELAQLDLRVFDEIDSTNLEAKRLAMTGLSRCAVIADRQTAGRGRLGRSFYSPPGCGIYTSLLLRPRPDQLADVTLLTTAAGVAVCRALEKAAGVQAEIKWVNDLYLNGKKICGILTEGVTDFESGMIESIVIGYGVNFRDDAHLPEELRPIVGSVFGAEPPTVTRSALAAAMLAELLPLAEDLSSRSFLPEYRRRSMLLGREIVFSRAGGRFAAVAEGIDDNGGLVVRLPDGSRETLRSGEVSVRTAESAGTLPE
ncbi:MAG: biotin--[acetyl-CoA-carboxylase] ligase [Oscillospiraceae bacterium]|nr:biotin--[acetyl-CoA-carboxylase] ligase [Oscillospiraceae bacterium]SFI67083.1 BirA family transcriptional regulator, biotin operon repressor / biotin-[acetyl-CoA-carboxylase] ligase [Ruminococcaceae bacterium D5]